jgi:hypothetical protein
VSAVENRRTIECSSTSSAEYLPTVEHRALLAHRGNSARECTVGPSRGSARRLSCSACIRPHMCRLHVSLSYTRSRVGTWEGSACLVTWR